MSDMSWAQYKVWVESNLDSRKDYFYRGHLDPLWKLQTSFHRHSQELGYSIIDYLNYIVPEALHYVGAYQNKKFDLADPDEFGAFLGLLQHHGFPTPLLDWTLSPYIAAYFAYREVIAKEPQVDSVKIYIFDYQEWMTSFQQTLNLRETTQKYVSVIRTHARYNPRVISQRGIYTVTNVGDMEQHLLHHGGLVNKNFLYIVTLPVNERNKVIRDLNLMGISEMTLFPGLDGVCNSLKEQYFTSPTVGLGPSARTLLESLKTKILPPPPPPEGS